MSSIQEEAPPVEPSSAAGGKPRLPDLRNAELVSRLLAATPPYLYSALPLQPHAYFFSEMLRSFVQARHDQRPPGLTPHARRAKKRNWNHGKYFATNENNLKADWQQRAAEAWNARSTSMQDDKRLPFDDKDKEYKTSFNSKTTKYEKPLELTINKHLLPPRSGMGFTHSPRRTSPDPNLIKSNKSPLPEEPAASFKEDKPQSDILQHSVLLPNCQNVAGDSSNVPASDLILPPPPPIWYPPLYPPPYGLDPLNFFIDLRVSGHIYDRKHGNGKEAPAVNVGGLQVNGHLSEGRVPTPEPFHGLSTAPSSDNKILNLKDAVRAHRHASAFSVPKPRDKHAAAMNLCNPSGNKFNLKYFDDVDLKNHEKRLLQKNQTSTHYVMHNLKRIYGGLDNKDNKDRNEEGKEGIDLDDSSESGPARGSEKIPSESGGSVMSDDDVIVEGDRD